MALSMRSEAIVLEYWPVYLLISLAIIHDFEWSPFLQFCPALLGLPAMNGIPSVDGAGGFRLQRISEFPWPPVRSGRARQ
jgi:hypothetical protein